MAALQTYPNLKTVYYSRSPIVYRYNNCASSNTFNFNLYIGQSTGTTSLYTTINRRPDLIGGITFDVSEFISSYTQNNIEYSTDNIVYFYSDLLVYSGSTLSQTITSPLALSTLGYVEDGVVTIPLKIAEVVLDVLDVFSFTTYLSGTSIFGVTTAIDLYYFDGVNTTTQLANTTGVTLTLDSNNDLKTIIVTSEPENNISGVTSISFSEKKINTINLNDLTYLTYLLLDNNPDLVSIDLSNNIILNTLSLSNNNLSSIYLSNNTLLTYLNLGSNSFTSLDLSNNTLLDYLYLQFNNLTSLDLSNNSILRTVYLGYNNFDATNLNNILDDLVAFNYSGILFNSKNQDTIAYVDYYKLIALDSIWITVQADPLIAYQATLKNCITGLDSKSTGPYLYNTDFALNKRVLGSDSIYYTMSSFGFGFWQSPAYPIIDTTITALYNCP